jgi:general secretion pathway protein L
MSGARFLLLLLGHDGGWAGWLRIDDDAVVMRGADVSAIPPSTEEERVVLVVPGTDVLLDWVDLPALAPAQALAAARLLAGERTATPSERLHIALGAGDGLRCMATADAERVEGWIAEAQAAGYDPDHLLPEPLLILPPTAGTRRWARNGLHIVRGETVGLAAEPELAALVEGEPVELVDDAAFAQGIGAAVAAMPVDLRQGAFAKRTRWRIDEGLVRRLAGVAGAIVLTTLLIQTMLILRTNADSGRIDRELQAVARAALPRGERIVNPSAQIVERLAGLRGGGFGFSASAALLFAAVRDTPNVELSQFLFDHEGRLSATVLAPSSADIAALERRLEARGLAVESGAVRVGGGRQIADFVVTAL